MAFIKYDFNEEYREYKGIKYYKFNDDEYIILMPDLTRAIRYTLKDVKSYINNYLNK